MVLGIALNSWLTPLSIAVPYLLALMIFISFAKIDFKHVKLTKMHFSMFAIQIVVSLLVYLALIKLSVPLAQGAMLCVLIPTATSAAVVVGILGGSIASIATYTLFCSVGCALITPLLFSMIGISEDIDFMESMGVVAKSVLPMFFIPLALSWVINSFLPKIKRGVERLFPASFYIWAFALMVVTGKTVDSIINGSTTREGVMLEVGLAAVSLVTCVGQFYIGGHLGKRYGLSLEATQAMGQKNTIYGIWLAQMYLVPEAALAPACYVMWQNIANSLRIWQHRRDGKLPKATKKS